MIKNVVEYLIESTRKYPYKIAVEDEYEKITFSELDTQARKLAHVVAKKCGDARNRPIAVYMDKSVACIIAFLGIAYSGNFYCPVDTKMPVPRIKKIMEVLQPMSIIYNRDIPGELADCVKQIAMEDIQGIDLADCNVTHYTRVLDSDPIYVLFTSGSTGQPKGVVISHRGVIDYTEWLRDKFSFDDSTIFGNQAPFYFDNSVLDIYSTLKCGATMSIIPERFFPFPNKLLKYIHEKNINTLFWVPSALINVANAGILTEFHPKCIRKILFCGEVMPNKQLNMWRKVYPDVLYANLYGPTEITDACTCYIIDREFSDEEALPIGTACENTEVFVLDSEDNPVQENEIGELCVRGTCLAMGYYGDMDKTKEVFTQNPLNPLYHQLIYRTGDLVRYNKYGELVYVGRKDSQIKRQGYRIELGEIETACSSLDAIKRVCAMYDNIHKRMVLFCSLDSVLGNMSEKDIYAGLKHLLPSYMLPDRIYIRDHLPINLNGKIDREKLRKDVEGESDDRKNIEHIKGN